MKTGTIKVCDGKVLVKKFDLATFQILVLDFLILEGIHIRYGV